MINLKKLKKSDLISCLNLIDFDKEHFKEFKTIGWSKKEIEIQLNNSLVFKV